MGQIAPGGAPARIEETAQGEGRGPALTVLAARGAPVTRAGERLLPVPEGLAGLLPEGGLRRGSTVAVGTGGAAGAASLALCLLGPATTAGAWGAVVGFAGLGLVAAAESGVALERLALVPHPGDQWSVVVAALLESVDAVLVSLRGPVRPGDARRLVARARERAAVLVVLDGAPRGRAGWPEPPDLRLEVRRAVWAGLGSGHGYLQERHAEIGVSGRRGASRPRSGWIRLSGAGAGAAVPPGAAAPGDGDRGQGMEARGLAVAAGG